MNEVLKLFCRERVIPVISGVGPQTGVPLGQALAAGGVTTAEITFRHREAPKLLKAMYELCPGLCAGAGTILNVEQAKNARSCGARFIVTPAFNPWVTDYCLEHDIPVVPGVCTPYEVEQALDKGLNFLKFFPAQAAGGTAMLRALAGPYGFVTFMPTGGITEDNLLDYLSLDNVAACGASWLAPQELIRKGNFDEITRRCKNARALADGTCIGKRRKIE